MDAAEAERCGLVARVVPAAATLEHIQPLSEGGNSHIENLAISHELCVVSTLTGRAPFR